jgi:hypothetical protein
MKTFRLCLKPDSAFPQFKRLHWEMVDISLEDVLLRGIHPWSGPEKHSSLVDEFMRRFNEDEQLVGSLESFGYSHEISVVSGYAFNQHSRFERALAQIREGVYFVEDLSYLELLGIAKQDLVEHWDHSLVVSLLRDMYLGFPDLRQFLKAKDKALKLSGYEDLDKYDLGKVLSLEDFEGHDNLLISKAIAPLNFRRVGFLDRVTDEYGRLRLAPEIKELTLAEKFQKPSAYIGLVWHVKRNGRIFRCCPDVGSELKKRSKAKEVSREWRTDSSEYCFETDLERLSRMVDEQVVEVSFPALNYRYAEEHYSSSASIVVVPSKIQVYHVGRFPTEKVSGEQLKEILRCYGVSMTGTKDVLLEKLAKLAADLYRKHLPALNAYFAEHRFIRVEQSPANSEVFPLLENLKYLRSLPLAIYLLKHLRGNAIVEAQFENDTYTAEDAASALIAVRVLVAGAFVRAG